MAIIPNINGLTEKTTVHDNDVLLIEDSEDLNSKKKAKISNLTSSGGSGIWNWQILGPIQQMSVQ